MKSSTKIDFIAKKLFLFCDIFIRMFVKIVIN
jgi:hypothetical protein